MPDSQPRASIPEPPLSLRDLRPSAEPAVVLSSLARCCVPSFSDACAVELSEGTDQPFHVSYPLPGEGGDGDEGAPSVDRIVTTPFNLRSSHGRPAFAGVMVHSWRLRRPAPSDAIIARLLVDGAISLVCHERLAEMAAAADERSAKLALEAISSKTIGQATGIVMATRGVNSADAADLLRRAARQAGRDVYGVAAAVVQAGGLGCLAEMPSRRSRGRPAPLASLRSLPDCP